MSVVKDRRLRRDFDKYLSDSASRPFGFRTDEDAGEVFPSVFHGIAYFMESMTPEEWEKCRENVVSQMRLFSFLDPGNARCLDVLFRYPKGELPGYLRDVRENIAKRPVLDALGTPNPHWEGRKLAEKEERRRNSNMVDIFKMQ